MKPKTFFAVSAIQNVTLFPNQVEKLEVTLNSGTSTALYLQFFDAWIQPVNGAVPVKSWPAGDTGYKEFKAAELDLGNGLWVGLSSTAATYTAAGGTLDILSVEFVQAEPVPGGTVSTGSATANLYTPVSGVPGRLLNLQADGSGLGAAATLMFFNKQTPANGDTPFYQVPLPVAVKTLNFGDGLRSLPQSNYLTVCVSSTVGTLTLGTAIPFNAKYTTV
jgi:hypothetical protein